MTWSRENFNEGEIMKRSAIALFILAAVVASAAEAPAFTWYLKADGTGDAATIQIAVGSAAPGDTVLLEPGTYIGPGNKNIVFGGKDVVVRGDLDRAGAIMDCEGDGRAFDFSGGEGPGARVENLTIRNGFVDISGGGAIRINLYSNPTVRDVRMENNHAPVGGAVVCWLSSPWFVNCEVIGNTTDLYGGGGGFAIHTDSDPIISRCWIEDNWASYSGGMEIYYSSATIAYCTIVNNSCTTMGGGIGCQFADPLITQCTIVGNASADSAGGIFLYQSAPDIRCSIIAFSKSGAGLWCYLDCSTPSLINSDIYGNADGDWIGCIEGMDLINENMWLDPMFCGWLAGDFYLQDSSPLAACIDPCACFVGAWDVGCAGITSVQEGAVQQPKSWSTLKRQYR